MPDDDVKPQHDLRSRGVLRVSAETGAMQALRVKFLEDLIVTALAPGAHVHPRSLRGFVASCEACQATRTLERIASRLSKERR